MNWQYISGFFDADGSITYTNRRKGRNKTVQLTFTNVHLNILTDIEKFIRKETGGKGFFKTKHPKKDTHQTSYELMYVDLPKTLAIIEKMRLVHPIKKFKCKLIKYLKTITPRNGKYTEELLIKRERFEKKFFSMG